MSDSLDLLWLLLGQDSPSGDESRMADAVAELVADRTPLAKCFRLGDSLIIIKGKPAVALYAHLDTTGFTLGYDRRLIPIGSPAPVDGTQLRQAGLKGLVGSTVKDKKSWKLSVDDGVVVSPGEAWVYAAEPKLTGGSIVGPYLDNRAGMWAALTALDRCVNIAVAFTTDEEHSGQGANVCGRYLFDKHGVAQSLISDITWDTEHVHCGKGPAVSHRDGMVPRKRFVDRVVRLAEATGIAFQHEIESGGGSDGGYLQRCGYPIDWVFVGAPEKHSHTDHESIAVTDLYAMSDLITALVEGLTT